MNADYKTLQFPEFLIHRTTVLQFGGAQFQEQLIHVNERFYMYLKDK